jgi:two-component system nitrogen regulation sensor histidine kinase GlnL
MSGRAARPAPRPAGEAARAAAFDLSPSPALIIGPGGALAAANEAAEALFGQGLALLTRGRLEDVLPADSALGPLLRRAREEGALVREHAVDITLFGQPPFSADAAATPLGDGSVLLTLSPRTSLDRSSDTGESPALAGLGRMLAHEIKNPLQGIRGAAQLLKSGVSLEDAPLAQLIVDETDRIRRLVDHMELFADPAASSERQPINIHAVLDRVRALAVNGVASGMSFREAYDPSLPPTAGDEDQLIQVFLNLVKNGAEAAEARGDLGGELVVSTAFRHGVRVRSPDGGWHAAPIEVRVQDNGPGVPERLRDHLFEPFVTTKPHGAGLGLPLVARLVAAHGGLIDFESEPGRTVFRVLLPVAREP